MKTLIVLSSFPGCGKSTWANHYASEHPGTIIIASDEIRKEITGTYSDFSKQDEVWKLFEKRIQEFSLIENVTIILDALNDLNSLRQHYVECTPDFDKHILVCVKAPYEQALAWNDTRQGGKRLDHDVMKKLYDKWEEPSQEIIDLFDEVITVQN